MSSEYYDDLHKKLGANKLNQDEQKELFKKFVDHGGEVVKAPKPSPDTLVGDEKPSKSSKKGIEIASSDKKRSAKDSSGSKSEKKIKEKKDDSILDMFSLNISSFFSGVSTLFGSRFKSSFIKSIKFDLSKHLTTLVYIVNAILDTKVGDFRIVKGMLIQQDPYSYELLRIANQIYNAEDFELFNKKASMYNSHIDIMLIEESYLKIYKKLYIFRNNSYRLKSAIQVGLDIQKDYNKLSPTTYTEHLENSNKAISYIYDSFFDKLHFAFCKIVQENIYLDNKSRISQLLQITDSQTLEFLIQEMLKKRDSNKEDLDQVNKSAVEKSDENTEDVKEDEEVEVPDNLQDGREWINKLDFTINNTTEKDAKHYFDIDDKMLKVYIILEEFEKEFSFILTSSKIKFNTDWMKNKKTDPKNELNDLYLGINGTHDNIRDYIEILKNIYKIENDPSISMSQKSDQMHKLTLNQTRISNITRTRLLDIMRTLENLLSWIVEKQDQVVQNPKDKLHFDTLDGNKRVEGFTSIRAIMLCYSFVGYLRHLLDYGELAGGSPKIPKK